MTGSFNFNALDAETKHEYPPLDERGQKIAWGVVGVMTLGLIYSYWNTLIYISNFWDEPQYSAGYFIPIFAAALLWIRRDTFRDVPVWQRWVGLGILTLGIIMRVVGTRATQYAIDNLSMIPCLIGIFVMVGGLPTLRWAAPSAAFLVFMMPWPRAVQQSITMPLQRLAAIASNYLLVTFGVDSFREGNNISFGLDEKAMNVAEQCSGLRMLTMFGGLAVALALLSRTRPWWERGLIVLSALPIALATNVVRITLTGLLFNLHLDEIPLIHKIFHDAPGIIMMPLAIGFLYLVSKILSNLVIEEDHSAPLEFETTSAAVGQVEDQTWKVEV